MSKNYDSAGSGVEVDRGTTEWQVHRNATADDGSVGLSVVQAIASARGVSALDIERPLYESVDLEALDALFEPAGGSEVSGQVVFTVDEYEVTVTAGRDVYVRPAD